MRAVEINESGTSHYQKLLGHRNPEGLPKAGSPWRGEDLGMLRWPHIPHAGQSSPPGTCTDSAGTKPSIIDLFTLGALHPMFFTSKLAGAPTTPTHQKAQSPAKVTGSLVYQAPSSLVGSSRRLAHTSRTLSASWAVRKC